MFKGNIYLTQLGGKVCGVVGEDQVKDRRLLGGGWWGPGGGVAGVEAVEAVGLQPIGEGGSPAVGCAIGDGPERRVCVEVPDQKGWDLIVEFM